jgi:signal peptide peptidase SppA
MTVLETLFSPIRGKTPIVSVVRLSGVIRTGSRFSPGLSLGGLADPLGAAFKNKRAKAVALLINSPGGSPVQSDLIAIRIRALAKEHKKPVVAFVEDVAASGGYWLALAADEIFANPSSIIGSIGVISAGFGFQDAIEKLGVERRVHTSGRRKSLLDPFRSEVEEDVAYLKEIQTEIHNGFRDWVVSRRGDKLRQDQDADLFEGKFWTGGRAVELGLVDGIGDLRGVMRSRFGDKTRFQVYGERRSLAQRLGMARAFGPPDLSEVASGAAGGMLEVVEDRAHWSRFGL